MLVQTNTESFIDNDDITNQTRRDDNDPTTPDKILNSEDQDEPLDDEDAGSMDDEQMEDVEIEEDMQDDLEPGLDDLDEEDFVEDDTDEDE